MNNNVGNIFHNVLCVYDGASSMLTNFRLPIINDKLMKFRLKLPNNQQHQHHHNDNEQEFEIFIKLIKTVSYSTIDDYYRNPMNDSYLEVVTAVNLIIRHLLMEKRFLIGRTNFHHHIDNDKNRLNLSILKELSFGISSSVQTCSSGLQLIMDRCCTPFIKSFMINDCIEYFQREMSNNNHNHQQQQRWNDFLRKRLEQIIKDYYFEVSNLKHSRRYRIAGITLESADKVMFKTNDNNGGNGEQQRQRMISVADYFHQTYGKLQRPDLPCVKVRRGRNEFIYFPAEICRIIADQKAKKLTTKEKSDLIRKVANINPIERLEEIRNSVDELIAMDNDDDNYLKEFGFNVCTQPITIRANVLDPPKLLEGDERPIKLNNGKWRYRKFFQPIQLKRWILVKLLHFDHSIVEKFLETFIRNGEQLGMKIDMPIRIDYDFNMATLKDFLQKLKQQYNDGDGELQLIFFIGCNLEWQHSAIKKFCDVDLELITQCMRQTNVLRINQSIAVNILHKINAKLGGINVTLDYGKIPSLSSSSDDYSKTMAIGVDVAHPSPSEKNLPSIAAMVANIDQSFARYSSSVKIQKFFRQEIIKELDKMLIDLLRAYEMKTNRLPEKIIFYRDGVSEGQFQVVYNEEILLIKKTLENYRPNHKFRLTFIIVQKRHHSRFIPDNSKDGVGRFYNIPPGTVVDAVVVHPKRFDFYLCSHAGIQGTSRPSHYCVLIDENQYTANYIHNFTNVLCHLYARCSRSISIPTPVFYAHLAAFRAREHIQ
ncbi:hypothetical protein BLA29_002685, partial [Euroglyphus maynei]